MLEKPNDMVFISFPQIKYSSKAILQNTSFKRLKGLMFKSEVGLPLLFEFPTSNRHSNAIHSFFCPHFDAAFIDENNLVTDYFQDVRPSKPLIVPSKDCVRLVEASAFSLKGLKPNMKFISNSKDLRN